MKKENYYDHETNTMNYFTESVHKINIFENTEKHNEAILEDFYFAVNWLLSKRYDEYYEITSRTINPAQQNCFSPLREYRVKRNGHYKTVNIYSLFWGGCWIEEKDL